MSNRNQRRRVLSKLGKSGRDELELLKGITLRDPVELEKIAVDFDSKGLKVAAMGVREAIKQLQNESD